MPEANINRKEALPSQQFVDVKEIKEGVVILRSGGLRQVVMVSGLNFDLKSEQEQEAIIGSYQSFLNSLDFPLQIFIHSRKINVDKYIDGLSQLEVKEANPLLRTQIAEYREFIRTLVSENVIMHKSFFVVVPYEPVQLAQAGKKAKKKFFGIFSKKKNNKKEGLDTENDPSFHEYLSQINQRSDQVISGLNQIGLRAVALNHEETTELFYNLYNPEAIEKKGLEINKAKDNQ
jgi:type IV secretory pathway VirB4 component